MPRIILHVGPEKCGSSTIQRAVVGPKAALRDLLSGVMLDPRRVLELDRPCPGPETESAFHALIETHLADRPGLPLVLSHEMMFKMVHVLANLSAIARAHAETVIVVAYIRRQSDFLVSSFGQWLFRAPARLAETAEVLRRHGLDPTLFWGVERHLIAAILGGWHIGRQLSGHLYLDWSRALPERAAALDRPGLSLSVGLLPRPGFDIALIPDFLARAGLDPAAGRNLRAVGNPAYSPALVEAVANAVEAGQPMPGPHEANAFFDRATRAAAGDAPDLPFLSRLKAHIDTEFEAANGAVARSFGFPAGYFTPATRIDGDAIRREIAAQAAARAAVPEDLRARDRSARVALARAAWALYRDGG